MRFRPFLTSAFAVSLAIGQERAPVEPTNLPAPDQAVEPAKPAIERLDATRYRIGSVTFDGKSREIRFPAEVNMSEGLLEYLLVRDHGKVHESLLITTTSATDINLAFTLLRYPPSAELYALPNDRGGLSDNYPKVPEKTRAAARVRISVEWNDAGKTRKVPVNEWIQHGTNATTMPEALWVYGGSAVYDGQFAAESTGDIAAIFISGASLLNYPGKDNRDDTVWFAYPKRVPPQGTKVTVVITPNPALANPPPAADKAESAKPKTAGKPARSNRSDKP